MSNTSRAANKGLLPLTGAAAILGVLIFWLAFGRDETTSHRAVTQAHDLPTSQEAHEDRPEGDAALVENPRHGVRLEVLDVATQRPVAQLPTTILANGDSITTTTDQHGCIQLHSAEAKVRLESDEWQLVNHYESYPSKNHGATVWVYRLVEVRGVLILEAPERVSDESKIRIVGGPVEQGSSEDVGSGWWFNRYGAEGNAIDAAVSGLRFVMRLPASHALAVVAMAPGHRFATCRLDAAAIPPGGIDITMTAEAATLVQVEAVDGAGAPVAGARVSLLVTLRVPEDELSEPLYNLYREINRLGFGVKSRSMEKPGVAEVYFELGGATDVDGKMSMWNPYPGSEYILLLRKPDFEVFERKATYDDAFSNIRVTMTPSAKQALPRYRILINDTPVRGHVYLAEDRQGRNPALTTLTPDKDGYVAAGEIQAGREYHAIFQNYDGGGSTWRTRNV